MLKDLLIPLITVSMGEMGDKTQLVTLTFATRYNWKIVMWGVFCGTLLLDLISVCLGQAVVRFIGHQDYITIGAGIAFVIFAIWNMRPDNEEEEVDEKGKSPFVAIFLTFFLAEMGDKTMLTTITMATQYNPLFVWIGATLGMVAADGLAVFVGMKLGKIIPEKIVKTVATVLFFVFGAYYIFIGLRGIL